MTDSVREIMSLPLPDREFLESEFSIDQRKSYTMQMAS
jgi:hypothetical protein